MSTMQADILEKLDHAEEAFTVRRVFGEPYEKDGVTVIPAAKVQGAVGGGGGEAPDGQGRRSGSRFAINTKPVRVFVMRDGDVTWRPAVDVNRMILGAQIVAIAALLLVRAIVRTRAQANTLSMLRNLVKARANAGASG